MRKSWFNSIVPYNGNYLLYNALSDIFLVVNKELTGLMQTNDSLDSIKHLYPKFYSALDENGFIVDDATPELELVKQKQYELDNDDSIFHLVINTTMNCNFSCWYCYESHEKKSPMETATIEKIKLLVANTIKKKSTLKKIVVSWFGGEPLLQYSSVILPLSISLKDMISSSNIELVTNYTTNGYLIKEEMIKEFKRFNTINFQITLDGDRDLHDSIRFVSKSRGSYDRIIDNIKMLCKNGLNVSLRLNYTKTNIDSLVNIYEDIKNILENDRSFLKITLHKVWQEKDTAFFSQKLLDIIRFYRYRDFSCAVGDLTDSVRASCYADKKNHATINYNGDVFKCTARDFSKKNKEGDLTEKGNIKWADIYDERLNIKFKNSPCLKCRILPICNGGCSQVALENKGIDYCVHDFCDSKKDELILHKFLQRAPKEYVI